MAQFADYQSPPKDPSYLGLSKEIDVPKIANNTASTISNLTQIGGSALTAVDEMNKNTIDKQLLASVNNERQESIDTGLDLLSGNKPPAVVNEDGSPNVPANVNQELRRAEMLTQAKKMGKVEDVNYYGNMQSIAQGLISRYPGYERYINDRMSHWLGTNPANAQRAAILNTLQTQNAATNSEANKWTTFVRQNLEYFSNPDGSFNQAMLAKAQTAFGNPQAQAEVETYISRMQSRKQAVTQATSELTLQTAQGTANESTALRAYRIAATEETNKAMTQQAFTIGGMSFNNWKDVEEQIDMIKSSGGKVDPEILAMFGQAVSRYRNHADAAMRKLANDPKFMALVQDPGKLQAIRNELLGNFDNIQAEVGAGNLRLATATINTFEGMSNNDALRALRGDETVRRWNQIRQTAGPAASTVLDREIKLDEKLPTRVSENLKLLNQMEIVSGRNFSMQDVVTRFNTAHGITGQLTPAQQAERVRYLQVHMDFAKRIATGQDVPPIMRENAARFIASGGTTEFLTKLPVDQQMSAWANLADPNTVKSLKATLPPSEWRNYSTWAQETFKSLVATQASQITRGAQDSQYTNITFEDGQLHYDNSRRTSQGGNRNAPVPISNNTVRAIQEINLGLQTYANILKADGKQLNERELEALGIKVQKPEAGGSTGTGRRSDATSGAPNGSEGPSTVSFITPAQASTLQIPPNDRVREDFRQLRIQEDNNPSEYIYDDRGVRQQLAASLPENRFDPRPGRVPGEGGGGGVAPGVRRYEIIDTQSGRTVGTYNTPNRSWHNRAMKRLEKLNDGGDRYQLKPILEQPSPVPFPNPR